MNVGRVPKRRAATGPVVGRVEALLWAAGVHAGAAKGGASAEQRDRLAGRAGMRGMLCALRLGVAPACAIPRGWEGARRSGWERLPGDVHDLAPGDIGLTLRERGCDALRRLIKGWYLIFGVSERREACSETCGTLARGTETVGLCVAVTAGRVTARSTRLAPVSCPCCVRKSDELQEVLDRQILATKNPNSRYPNLRRRPCPQPENSMGPSIGQKRRANPSSLAGTPRLNRILRRDPPGSGDPQPHLVLPVVSEVISEEVESGQQSSSDFFSRSIEYGVAMLKRQRMCTHFMSKACQSMPNELLMQPTFDADDPCHLAWPDQMPRSSDHSPLDELHGTAP
ncbi:hypothetical protein B0H14DRAFT_2620426 [Mycena olivaceomarginata]|nr:hypothetical protein B0H14DRAFT_2620426 [Mycena olivaceomarginata]